MNLDPKKLSDWINEDYIRSYEARTLHVDFCKTEPFKRAVLPNFLKQDVLDRVLNACDQIPLTRADSDEFTRTPRWYWGAFDWLPLVRFFYAGAGQNFLQELMQEPLRIYKEHTPQYNRFLASSKGLPIHTDDHQPVQAVSLLQITRDRTKQVGGHLQFHEQISDSTMRVIDDLPPGPNTFAIFKVAKNSYHSVTDLEGSWIRENIAFDWSI